MNSVLHELALPTNKEDLLGIALPLLPKVSEMDESEMVDAYLTGVANCLKKFEDPTEFTRQFLSAVIYRQIEKRDISEKTIYSLLTRAKTVHEQKDKLRTAVKYINELGWYRILEFMDAFPPMQSRQEWWKKLYKQEGKKAVLEHYRKLLDEFGEEFLQKFSIIVKYLAYNGLLERFELYMGDRVKFYDANFLEPKNLRSTIECLIGEPIEETVIDDTPDEVTLKDILLEIRALRKDVQKLHEILQK